MWRFRRNSHNMELQDVVYQHSRPGYTDWQTAAAPRVASVTGRWKDIKNNTANERATEQHEPLYDVFIIHSYN